MISLNSHFRANAHSFSGRKKRKRVWNHERSSETVVEAIQKSFTTNKQHKKPSALQTSRRSIKKTSNKLNNANTHQPAEYYEEASERASIRSESKHRTKKINKHTIQLTRINSLQVAPSRSLCIIVSLRAVYMGNSARGRATLHI